MYLHITKNSYFSKSAQMEDEAGIQCHQNVCVIEIRVVIYVLSQLLSSSK